MTDLHELVDGLTTIVVDGGDRAPERICAACVAALPVTGAAITVMSGPQQQQLICATDELIRDLDELQFRLGEGPGVDAFIHGRPIFIADLNNIGDSRWPVYAAAARRTPARAQYVLPLQAGSIGVGVLDLYHVQPGPLSPVALTGALRVADAALWTLLGLRSGGTLGDGEMAHDVAPNDWLRGAPLQRIQVYQATGMIIAQLDVDAETALAWLRAHAFEHEESLDAVASVLRPKFVEEL
ncbi:MAG: GAF domain-containing protein [Pseudonocardiaceae bacterium]|nr:GAF domain-containing protein [Pseudonocardiaceae bacterium]